MGLDEADDDVHAALLQGMGLFEHAVGLADAGGKTEIDLQPAALGPLDDSRKSYGPRPRSLTNSLPGYVTIGKKAPDNQGDRPARQGVQTPPLL